MRRALTWLALALALVAPGAAAEEIEVRDARLEFAEDGIVLDADFAFDLTSRLEDALAKGVPLYFVVEFEIYRPRWYWLDERIGVAARSTRLSFHALTRTYRLNTGAMHQSFATLDEALRTLSRVRGWVVLPTGALRPDSTYAAYSRMRLDTTQLPKPFQVSALANRDWTLASQWKKWEVSGPIEAEAAK
ncbi:MAG TPA: DUF4390 domain-containing protein [Burkholderiales bacterium]|jgi:hypothetical protein|nr:DUF4390 domain-containing protein [Burkholderiales bacterium]